MDGTDTVVGPCTTSLPKLVAAALVSAAKTSSGLSASICAWGRHDSVRGRGPARGGSTDVRYVGDASKSGCDRRVAGDMRSSIAQGTRNELPRLSDEASRLSMLHYAEWNS